MTDVEERMRDELTDPWWDLPVPSEPMSWVFRRIAKEQRRRAAVALPLCAALTAGVTVVGLANIDGSHRAARSVAAAAGEWTTERDGLAMTVRLSNAAPAGGEEVTGSITVTNHRPDAIKIVDPCDDAPTLTLDYSALVPAAPAAEGDPLAEFAQRVTRRTPPASGADRFRAPTLGAYRVAESGNRSCAADAGLRDIAAGDTTVRRVAWTVGSPNGTAVNSDLPGRAVVAYLLPDNPDGTKVPGDPTSEGSSTPSARLLDLQFALAIHGGDPGRPGVDRIVQAATGDARFAAVLRQQPRNTWRFGWALTVDKASTAHAVSFGEQDTNPMLTPAPTWFVSLVYSHIDGDTRITAQIDGATARVLSVSTRLEGSTASG